ncbi:MAG: formylmethanofuran dehydrogenase subunit E family protein [Deltaproteobacteria bacterium]|jgi:formylmethanofuran dehydrogenase subunit E|nr:formylmethanofuran dehydrogenase subunit E family protein [Deltaproteobacteria bacterium]
MLKPDSDAPHVCGLGWNEFVKKLEDFHGYAAPGALWGGIMVDMARERLKSLFGPDALFWVLVESYSCLPDAVQLLTPCTVGNRRLQVLDLNRYALTLYTKPGGQGVRIFVDGGKLGPWPHLQSWFMGLVDKKDQDANLLTNDIRLGGASACSMRAVRVPETYLRRERKGKIGLCPACGEPYPLRDGERCLACRGGFDLPVELKS